ncbi:ABC transporter ATP-binding protein [Paenibacillus sp. 2RAB27]|uniref:ABC transporter ATP-binding protein n=1 Tax=Paenibacillus sp. 2RAB27 TaxID=3232991 RepID=UPI003F9E609E
MKLYVVSHRRKWLKAFARELKPHKSLLLLLLTLKIGLILLGLTSPLLFKVLIDDVMVAQKSQLLLYVCLGYIGIYVIESFIMALYAKSGNALTNKLSFTLRSTIWKYYSRIPLSRYEKMNAGDLKNRIDGDVEAVDRFAKLYLLEYSYSMLFVLVSGFMMFTFNWKLALFGMLMVPLSFWMTRWLGKGAKIAAENYREVDGKYQGWLQHSLRGWQEIKAGGLEKRSSLTFTEYWHQLSEAFFRKHLFWYGNRTFQAIKDFFITRMNLYFVGGLLIIYGEMSIGTLLVFMKYYEQFFTEMAKINDLDMQFASDIPSLERVSDVCRGQDEEITSTLPFKLENGSVSFEKVSFTYEEANETAVKQVSFHIPAGKKVAIIGRSGSGKSTLIKLLLGLYEQESGRIVVDDTDTRLIRPVELHRAIGAVMQDPAVFNMSILDNVRLANPSASNDEVMAACRKAYMDEFISKLPDRYSTLIGEKGVKLSGGQKQRLAMARVILSGAPIIVFDEATSQLDHESEKEIHSMIDQLAGDRTMIIIAHRLSSIIGSDHIILINNGEVEDQGKHEYLWHNSETYRSLFRKPINAAGA